MGADAREDVSHTAVSTPLRKAWRLSSLPAPSSTAARS